MTFRNIRPLHVLWQDGTSVQMMDVVLSTISKFLVLAGVSNELKFKCLGQRREIDWLSLDGPPTNKLLLKAYKSLNWHIEWTRLHSKVPGHLNSAMLLHSVLEDPNYQAEEKYVLVVVHEPLYWHDGSPIIVGGDWPTRQRRAHYYRQFETYKRGKRRTQEKKKGTCCSLYREDRDA